MKAVTTRNVRVKGKAVPKGTVIDEPKEVVNALIASKGASTEAADIKKAEADAKKADK